MSAGPSSASSASSASTPPPQEVMEEAVKRYRDMRSREQMLITKISELVAQESEHKSVCETLRPIEGSRKCFHLIGGVLCEKTVKEVLPAIELNQQGITDIIKSLNEDLAKTNKARVELQTTHGIRVVSQGEANRIAAAQQKAAAAGGAGGGASAAGAASARA